MQSLADFTLPEEFIAEKVSDIVHIYGPTVKKEILFNEENAAALKIEIAKYKELMRFRTSPSEFLKEKCQKVCGKDAAEIIESLMPQISKSIQKCAPLATLKDLEVLCQFLGQIRELINIQELKDLESWLKSSVGDDLTAQIISDWEYIGRDISE